MTKDLESPIKDFIEKPQYYTEFLEYLELILKIFKMNLMLRWMIIHDNAHSEVFRATT